MISNTSGASGIAAWLRQHVVSEDSESIQKTDPLVVYLKNWVDEQYANGRVTAITDNELMEQMEEWRKQ